MNRFLHLFAEHRAALQQAQRAEDMLLHERARADKAEELLQAAQQDAIRRERELYDRVTVRPVAQEQTGPVPDIMEHKETVKDWQKKMNADFIGALERRAAKLRGDAMAANQ